MIWTSAEAIVATGGHSTSTWVAEGISIDSRTLTKGDLFVALSDIRDGHDFVEKAFEAGASAALVSRIPKNYSGTKPLLIVNSVQQALEDMARYRRRESRARIIAVTGSVGKTTTKELLRFVLSKQGKTHAAEKSYNNHWGVPLSLARMPKDTQFGVFEIGMNNPGEILPLSRLVEPHVGIVTSVGTAHLASFEDVNAIAREKAQIFEGLSERGTAIINGDLDTTGILVETAKKQGAKIIKFGYKSEVNFQLKEIRFLASGGTQFNFLVDGTEVISKISARGEHFALNAMAVLAAVREIGGNEITASLDLSSWTPQDGRGVLEKINLDNGEEGFSFDLLDDSYNANPMSLMAGFKVMASMEGYKRKVAILSDMLELGPDGPEIHSNLAGNPICRSVTQFHCIGPLMKNFYDSLPQEKRGIWVETADEIFSRIKEIVAVGDLVFVKGSKGSRAADVVEKLKLLHKPG
ncbi:MAG: UDP-N-acetylmuramoyl-tripeptide--D-alanyl-D-alanine ligase [Rhodobacteraceae bacterium]|nr:UDP-N-acetylmuramoyl-tripeptide--D-alanyl-D-alanine ligase [Paracoccaceae bacterium]